MNYLFSHFNQDDTVDEIEEDVPDEYINFSDQEYVLANIKKYLRTDPKNAASWMITARSLYPNHFEVQFQIYLNEKEVKNAEGAANCFVGLLKKFREEARLWLEIDNIAASLRSEKEHHDAEVQFMIEMFKKVPLELQHQLLFMSAEHCVDTVEHCRLLLLLLKKFPQSICIHAPKLIDTLLSAEKHSHSSNQPENCYRKLLICELLPLLSSTKIDLSSKLLYRLLNKAIEYYVNLMMKNTKINDRSRDRTNTSWIKLTEIVKMIGKHLHWHPTLTNFGENWNKDFYWMEILIFNESLKSVEHKYPKQLLYSVTLLFLYCLCQYTEHLSPDVAPGQFRTELILTEAFNDPNKPLLIMGEPKPKMKKTDSPEPRIKPRITVAKPGTEKITVNFNFAVKCWEFLQNGEIRKDFSKLSHHLKLDYLIADFKNDYNLYVGNYDEVLIPLQSMPDPSKALAQNIRLMNIYYRKKQLSNAFGHLLMILSALPSNTGEFYDTLTIGGNARHLHYLPMTYNAILQYCVRILAYSINENMAKNPTTFNDLAIGIIFVLAQLDLPEMEDLIIPLLAKIKQQGSFHFPMLQGYIINVMLLAEIVHLRTETGGKIALDIFQIPQTQVLQRRIGTRGADKGEKEVFKQAVKRQLARYKEPVDKLILEFIDKERLHILQTLTHIRLGVSDIY